MPTYCVAPEILTVRTSVPYIPRFSLGEHLSVVAPPSKPAKVQLSFEVTHISGRPKELEIKHHYYYVGVGNDSIYCERNIGFGATVRLLISQLYTEPTISANELYYRLVRSQLGVLLPPGRHLLDVATVALLRAGLLPLHCAAVSREGQCLLIFAPPDTGKTFTALALRNQGFSILSEDMAITDGKTVWSCPFTGTFYHLISHSNQRGWRGLTTRAYASAVELFPPLARLVRPPIQSLWSLTGGLVQGSSRIGGVVFLRRSGTSLCMESLSGQRAFHFLQLCNRVEFTYDSNPALLAFASVDDSFDLTALRRRELEMLQKLGSQYPAVLVCSDDYREFPTAVRQIFASLNSSLVPSTV